MASPTHLPAPGAMAVNREGRGLRQPTRPPRRVHGRPAARKARNKKVSWRSDPYLAFGMLLVPAGFARPITTQLIGTRFVDLTEREAGLVVEGLAYLQWVKAGLLGFVGGAVLILARHLSGVGRHIAEAAAAVLMMWLPVYMLLLSAVWWALPRASDVEGDGPVSRRRRLLLFMRAAPVLSLILALPFTLLQ